MIAGSLVERLAAQTPEILARLREAVASGAVEIVGGEESEGPLSLGGEGMLHRELRRGRDVYRRHLGVVPTVFARRRYGLSPMWPQVLAGEGFVGALHFTLEEGRTPTGQQSKTTWEGRGGVDIPALAKPPLRADEAGTFLGFGVTVGEAMDADHVASVTLARWAGQSDPSLADLRRLGRYSAALGRFGTISKFLTETERPVHFDAFPFDDYRSPHLKQAVIRGQSDPIGTVRTYWHRVVRAHAWNIVETLATLLGRPRPAGADDAMTPAMLLARADAELHEAYPAVRRQPDPVAAAASDPGDPGDPSGDFLTAKFGPDGDGGSGPGDGETLPITVAGETDGRGSSDGFDLELIRLAGAIVADAAPVDGAGKASGGDGAGLFLFNPWPVARRTGIVDSGLTAPPTVERPVYAAERTDGGVTVIADLPAGGYVHLSSGSGGGDTRGGQPLVADGVLRNEFFELLIHPDTGSLQSIHDYDKRGNRLSTQIALRGDGDTGRSARGGGYSRMAVEEITTVHATATVGEVASRGRLLVGDTVVGRYRQSFRIFRGSRVIDWTITIEPERPLRADGWDSYYCARFAWGDEAASLRRGAPLVGTVTSAERIEAPLYLELAGAERRTAILTGGIPYHVRRGGRMLDTILIPRGESSRTFRLGIGVELPAVAAEALAFAAPRPGVLVGGALAAAPSAWLIHVDQPTVIASQCHAIYGPAIDRPLDRDESSRPAGDESAEREPADHESAESADTDPPAEPVSSENGQATGEAADRSTSVDPSGPLPDPRRDRRGARTGDAARRSTDGGADAPARDRRPGDDRSRVAVPGVRPGLADRPGRATPGAARHPWRGGEGRPGPAPVPRDRGPLRPMIVTIDGPAGAGKSTVARRLAETLGFAVLDTGALYRAVTLAAQRAGIDLADAAAVANLAAGATVELTDSAVILDGADVTEAIRTAAVSRAIYHVADVPAVRRQLTEIQRRIAAAGDYVTEGRDQGTVVFPDAAVKVYLDASTEARAPPSSERTPGPRGRGESRRGPGRGRRAGPPRPQPSRRSAPPGQRRGGGDDRRFDDRGGRRDPRRTGAGATATLTGRPVRIDGIRPDDRHASRSCPSLRPSPSRGRGPERRVGAAHSFSSRSVA